MELLFDTDINHLGVLIGNRHSERIVALSTSDVFIDRSLIPSLWGKGNEAIDSGFQAHLYTRPEDIFVVRVPSNGFSAVEKVQTAIDQNCLMGIGISFRSSPDHHGVRAPFRVAGRARTLRAIH